MKKTMYQEPILEVIEVVSECGFSVSSAHWVDGGAGGDFIVNDYDGEL